MLRGLFVDRHFYTHDADGRGRWATFSRATQIRLATIGLLVIGLGAGSAATLAFGWLSSNAVQFPARAGSPVVVRPAAEPSRVLTDETAALRMALEESRGERAELAAQLENLQRRPVETGPAQADLDRVQASYEEAAGRAEAAERAAAVAVQEADAARREAAARLPIQEASIPDRIRALELELDLARSAIPLAEEAPAGSLFPPDPVDNAFTPNEEVLALRVRELEATVAELEAERNVLEERLAKAAPLSESAPIVEEPSPAAP